MNKPSRDFDRLVEQETDDVSGHVQPRPEVAIEVGDDAGRVDPPCARRPLAQEPAPRVVDERAGERRDDLELLVAAGGGQVVPAARREVVEDPDAMPLVQKTLRHVRADEACAAGHKVDR